MYLYLLNYNLYFNRIVKKEPQLSDYIQYVIPGADPVYDKNPVYDVNFKPNDGIRTTCKISWQGAIPDYVLAVEEDNFTINSRWYVVESTRLRNGQFRLSLVRDVMAEYLEEIMSSPCFIEKAILPNDNKLIYNKEDITVSQIKTKEWLLTEAISASVPWIVGYFDSKKNPTTNQLSFPAQEATLVSTTDTWGYYKYSNLAGSAKEEALVPTKPIYRVFSKWTSNTATVSCIAWDDNGPRETNLTNSDGIGNFTDASSTTGLRTAQLFDGYGWALQLADNLEYGQANIALSQFSNQMADFTIASIENLNGKTIYFSDTGKAYSIEVNQVETTKKQFNVVDGTPLFQAMNKNINVLRSQTRLSGTATNGSFDVVFDGISYDLKLTPITLNEISLNFPENSTLPQLDDAPYKMFCMPYGEITIYNEDRSQELVRTVPDVALKMAQLLSIEGGAWLYDLQLLPYNPFSPGSIPSPAEGEYQLITDSEGTAVSAILFPKSSSFTVNVGNVNLINAIAEANNNGSKKMENECDMFRLVSPNGNGAFEFNRAKLGTITNIVADCTYRPYSPYIQIRPQFSGMYGTTFNKDQRGLICGGDFSLPRTTDAWTAYELQNKNYEKTFQRQIENLEIQNNYQRTMQIASTIAGSVSGGVSGATAGGFMSSSPVGAAVGAAGGLAASAAAGIADIMLSDELRTESVRYAQDRFGYSLGNIKAMPQSLSKISGFTINNKIFPYLEYYTCSKEERQAVYNKIKYNGMTVMTIGTLNEYRYNKLPDAEYTYLKGELIRLNNSIIKEDSHIAVAIYEELRKGVYI